MIKVVREPEEIGGPYERCCKCYKPTPFWYIPKDVALCPECSKTVKRKDIPTKKQWDDDILAKFGFRTITGNYAIR